MNFPPEKIWLPKTSSLTTCLVDYPVWTKLHPETTVMERTFTLTEELDLLNNIPTNSNPLIALELANIEIVNPDALSDAYWSPVEKSLALQQ